MKPMPTQSTSSQHRLSIFAYQSLWLNSLGYEPVPHTFLSAWLSHQPFHDQLHNSSHAECSSQIWNSKFGIWKCASALTHDTWHCRKVVNPSTRPWSGNCNWGPIEVLNNLFLRISLKCCFCFYNQHVFASLFLLFEPNKSMGPTSSNMLRLGFSYREEALRAFKLGVLSLQERAEIDRLFELCCKRICELGTSRQIQLPKPLLPESRPHSLMYHVNLSGQSFL